MSAVRLVMFSAFDLAAYLPIARNAVGHSVSTAADASGASEETHNMMCLAGLVGGDTWQVSHIYTLAYLVATDDRDMPAVVQIASMPHILTDSVKRGVQVAVIAGPLSQWRDAVRRGCREAMPQGIRHIYNLIYKDLDNRGLCGTLEEMRRRPLTDETFLLEYKT